MENILPRRLKALRERTAEEKQQARSLTEREISFLEKEGNRCSNWEDVRTAPHFDPARVIGCTFRGRCYLGDFSGEDLTIGDGLTLPPGAYHSVISESHLSDRILVYRTGSVHRYLLAEGAAVLMGGQLSGASASGAATISGSGSAEEEGPGFLSLRHLEIGSEAGGRRTMVTPGISLEGISRAALQRDPAVQKEIGAAAGRSWEALVPPEGFAGVLDRGSRVISTGAVIDTYLGPAGRIESAGPIRRALILSTEESPAEIAGGAQVTRSILQPGASADSQALAQETVLAEHSRIERQAKVTQSYLGPNTTAAEGEITASLVGPFVGFHHQSLLIGALWPEGRGNIAAGAQVGSNHTGRLPDQELRGGAGLFFGLGCVIKYPADFSQAPHTLIAAGVTTLPQRVAFPFSLIAPAAETYPGISPALPEIRPGWVFRSSPYQLRRTAAKIAARNRARYHTFTPDILSAETAGLLRRSIQALSSAAAQPVYTEQEIPGLGKNLLTEENRRLAVEIYTEALRYWLLSREHQSQGKIPPTESQGESPPAESQAESPPEDLPAMEECAGIGGWTPEERRRELIRLEELFRERLVESRRRDDRRGERLGGADYRLTHPSAEEDPFLREEEERIQKRLTQLKGRS